MTETKTIGRKRKKNGFTQISNTLLEDSRLSWKAKGLLCYLMSRPDSWKINKTDICNRGAEGRDSMQNGLKELKEYGYLHIYPSKAKNGQFEGWIWEYDDVPFVAEILENHITEKQHETAEIVQDFRSAENSYNGNLEGRQSSTYNNTDFNNTNYNNTDTKEINKKNTIKTAELEQEFEQLWKLYPRKEGKTDAKKHYIKARKAKTLYETVEKGLYRYKEYLEQQGTESQYIPHGSSWFCQERWNDEYVCAATIKKHNISLMDMYRRDFGGNDNESKRNTSIFNSNENGVSEYIPQSTYF